MIGGDDDLTDAPPPPRPTPKPADDDEPNDGEGEKDAPGHSGVNEPRD
jgi:hypothetical protein